MSDDVYERVADQLLAMGGRIRKTPRRFRFVTEPCEPYEDERGNVYNTKSHYEEVFVSPAE